MRRAFLNPWVILISLLLAEPLAGFGCGVIICADCGCNPFHYLLAGVLESIISIIAVGHCLTNESGGTNLWPFVPFTAIALWAFIGSCRLALKWMRHNSQAAAPHLLRTLSAVALALVVWLLLAYFLFWSLWHSS